MRCWYIWIAVAIVYVNSVGGQKANSKVLLGAGGSFQSPLYQDWGNTFNVLSPDISVKYEGITQSDGRARLLAGSIDFAGSDYNVFSDADYAAHPTFRLIPTFAANVGFSYNVKEFSARTDPNLVLDRGIISRIFRGNLTMWNDPDLVALQKRVYPNMSPVVINGTSYAYWDYKMPARAIKLGLRSDAALVTTVLGVGLAAVDSWWPQTFGDYVQRNSTWPSVIQTNRTMVKANLGMLGFLTTTADAMGYHPYPYLVQFPEIKHFLMVNAWGNVADPSDMDQLEQVMQAHTASQLSVDDYRIVLPEIIDPPAPKSWPYSTFNYIVVDTNSTLGNCENRTALWKWVNWIVTSQTASEVARRKGYVQIPSNLATTVLSRVRANFTCSTPTGDVSLLLKDIPFPQRDGGHTAAIVIELICFSSTLVALAVFVFLVFKTSETATLEFFFTGVFAIGAMLVAIAVILWFLVPTADSICKTRVWFSALGISLTLSSMFTRQYHLWKIYGDYKRNKLVTINTMVRKLLVLSSLIVFASVAVQMIILILWEAINPFTSATIYRDSINLITERTCQGNNVLWWLLAELIYVLSLLGFGIYVIYLAWDLRGHASETRGLFIATYNMVLLCCILTPLAIVVVWDDSKVFFIASITLTFAIMSTGVALYWRKIAHAHHSYSSARGRTTSGGTISSKGVRGKRTHDSKQASLQLDS